MTCSCRQSVKLALSAARRRGEKVEAEQVKRLESFKEGVREGAYELVARHLYRAGVYFAFLDGGLFRDTSPNQVMTALTDRVSNMNAALGEFFRTNISSVERQSHFVDASELLRGILRFKGAVKLAEADRLFGSARGLLEGNGQRELSQAEKILERLNRLERYLESWREASRPEAKVEVVEIADMHS